MPEELLSEIMGSKVKITRSDVGKGTFGGEINANMRVALPEGSTTAQRKTFLSTYGRAMNQEGMAWSTFGKSGQVPGQLPGQVPELVLG